MAFSDKDGVIVLGDSPTPSNNITIKTPSIADGSLEIYQGVPGALGSKLYTFNPNGTAGTGPAFSAYKSATAPQNITSSVDTKVIFDVEEYDTNSNFSNSRFTPTVAGHYLITASVGYETNGNGLRGIGIYKNGARVVFCTSRADPANWISASATSIIQLNGTTDYVEVYVYQASGSSIPVVSAQDWTWIKGFLARAA